MQMRYPGDISSAERNGDKMSHLLEECGGVGIGRVSCAGTSALAYCLCMFVIMMRPLCNPIRPRPLIDDHSWQFEGNKRVRSWLLALFPGDTNTNGAPQVIHFYVFIPWLSDTSWGSSVQTCRFSLFLRPAHQMCCANPCSGMTGKKYTHTLGDKVRFITKDAAFP